MSRMRAEPLIVEHAMLLLHADNGRSIAGAAAFYSTLGSSLLCELALLGRIKLAEQGDSACETIVHARGSSDATGSDTQSAALDDDLLDGALQRIADQPSCIEPLVLSLGANLRPVVLSRLERRGFVRREGGAIREVRRSTLWPAHEGVEKSLRCLIVEALEGGGMTDARTATIIGLLSASGILRKIEPTLSWDDMIARRAREFERGEWAAGIAATETARSTVAIACATIAATVGTSPRLRA